MPRRLSASRIPAEPVELSSDDALPSRSSPPSVASSPSPTANASMHQTITLLLWIELGVFPSRNAISQSMSPGPRFQELHADVGPRSIDLRGALIQGKACRLGVGLAGTPLGPSFRLSTLASARYSHQAVLRPAARQAVWTGRRRPTCMRSLFVPSLSMRLWWPDLHICCA